MNKDRAIAIFLERLEQLPRLPLISDTEMAELFGEEVTAALAELDACNRREGICLTCNDQCCRLVSCEFHFTGLKRCPIHDFRPVLCRMHYCRKFASDGHELLIKELGDIFLDSLLAAEDLHREKVGLLDSPPLGKYAPALVANILLLKNDIRKGKLDESAALELIQIEAKLFTGDHR